MFYKMILHQLLSILIIGGAAGLATLVTNNLVDNVIISFFTAGFIYMFLLIVILFSLPSLFSLDRNEIIKYINMIKQQLSR